MNSNKTFLFGCALAVAMAPTNSYAATGQAGLEACTDAMVSKLTESSGNDLSYKFATSNVDFDRHLNSLELISLYARDSASNELVSRVDCIVNGKGRVMRLKTMPLHENDLKDAVTQAN